MEFLFEQPATVEEAVRILAHHGEAARALMGGSDLLVAAKEGTERPEVVVDLTRVPELTKFVEVPGEVSLGAALSLDAVARIPSVRDRHEALAEALLTMGSVQLRTGATVGGNLVTASPAADTGPPLLVHDAVVEYATTGGRRQMPVADLFRGPRECALAPGEVLVRIILPRPPTGARGVYLKHARRRAVDLALASAAALCWRDDGAPSGLGVRLALGAVAPTPIRVPGAEEILRERAFDEAARGDVREAVEAAVSPITDVRATAEYRREVAGTLAVRAVEGALRKLESGGRS